MSTSQAPIIVVGAGMAGLTCAVELRRAGRDVLIIEATDGVGGRVRTDRHPDGFLLDHGFQVILNAYPALRRHVDLAKLQTEAFDAGAIVWTGSRRVPLADPVRHPGALPRDITAPLFPLRDKARLAALAARTRRSRWQSAAEAATETEEQSAAEALWAQGFGRGFVDRFARPFWGGILLDRSLGMSAGPLRFTLKMFLEGSAVLPQAGVQAVPDQLASRLPTSAIRSGQPVEELVRERGCVTGVKVAGETLPAAAVVVATDPPTARRLTGINAIPSEGRGCVTVYLEGERDPGTGKKLVLDGTGTSIVNHLAPLSVVAPSYAPPGRHLLAAVLLGDHQDVTDDILAHQARDAAASMLGHAPEYWAPLATVRVPFSQFAQPPGIYRLLPSVATAIPGLYLATEATVDSSLNGAMLSGEAAAREVENARSREVG